MIQKKDRYYIQLAKQVSTASKCKRAKFGCVIVSRDGRVVTTSYNGKPRGSCNDDVCYREGLPSNAPKRNCCLHSESNALLFSAPWEREGGTMYVTGRPCEDCSLLIQQSGIARLVYLIVEDGSHPGWTGEDVFKQYGSKIEVVGYTDEKWGALYGVSAPGPDETILHAFGRELTKAWDHQMTAESKHDENKLKGDWCDCDRCVAAHSRRFASQAE